MLYFFFIANQQHFPTEAPLSTTSSLFEVTSAASSSHSIVASAPQTSLSSPTTNDRSKLVTSSLSSGSSSFSRIPVTTKPLNYHELISRFSSPSLSQFISSTPRPEIHPDCPGVCMRLEHARLCGNIMSNGICNYTHEFCCLQGEITLKESENLTKPLLTSQTTLNILQHRLKPVMAEIKPGVVSTSIDFPDDRSKNKVSVTSDPWKRPHDRNLTREDFSPATLSTQAPSTAFTTPVSSTTMEVIPTTTAPAVYMEDCDGTCVNPIFQLLCDEIAKDKYCPNGGYCCFNREPTTTTPAPTTPTIPPCPGTCIPVFFSGAFCNRPAVLIPNTADCMSGTICCAENSEGTPHEETSSNNMNENSALDDDEDTPPMLVHPPPQINRPVPKPLLPPPNLMYGPNVMFPSRIHPQQVPPHKPQPPHHYGNNFPNMHHMNRPMRPNHIGPLFMNGGPNGQRPINSLNHGKYGLPSSQNSADFDPRPIATDLSPHISDPPPMCPAVCLTPLLKFTCFGTNVLYPTFQCQSPEEICCAPSHEVRLFEASLMKNFHPNNVQEIKMPVQQNVVPNFLQQHGIIGPKRPALHQQNHQERPIIRPQQQVQQHQNHDQRPLPPASVLHNRDHLPMERPHPMPSKHLQPPPKVMHVPHIVVRHDHHQSHPHSPHSSPASPQNVLHTQNFPPTEPTVSLNSPTNHVNNNLHSVTSNSWIPSTTSSPPFNATALISSLSSLLTSTPASTSPTTPSVTMIPITVSTTEVPFYSSTSLDSLPGKYSFPVICIYQL